LARPFSLAGAVVDYVRYSRRKPFPAYLALAFWESNSILQAEASLANLRGDLVSGGAMFDGHIADHTLQFATRRHFQPLFDF
jgi:hypothetical protein